MIKSLTKEIDEAFDSWYDKDASRYESFKAGWEASKADSHNHKAVVEYDMAPAMVEGKLYNKLVEMGWTPPGFVRSPVTGAIGTVSKRLKEKPNDQ